MHWYPAPFDPETTSAWLDRTLASYAIRGYGLLIVEDRVTGEFLGTAGPTRQVVEGVDEVEIGWHSRPWAEGGGHRAGGCLGGPPGRSRTSTSTI
jgi:RimJ/RimL family protein N-acetyltransferase